MAVAESNVVPSALCELVDGLGVEHAVRADVVALDTDVLCVNVVNAICAELVHCRYRVATHPHQVAGIEVHADHRADGVTQTNERLRIVDHLAAVVLECDLLNAVGLGKLDRLFPVGDKHLVPLPVQNLGGDRRPARYDPVRRVVLRRAARATGHHNDLLDAEQTSQLEGLFYDLLMLLAFLIRCKLVARAVEHFEHQTALCNRVHVVLAGFLAGQHGIEVDVRCLGPVTASNLDGLVAESGNRVQHFFKRHVAEAVGI